jgi:hypothetical protein
MNAALVLALLATSPQPGNPPPRLEPGRPPTTIDGSAPPTIMRGRDGGGIGALGRLPRIAVDDKATAQDFLTALRAHVEPMRGTASTCWVLVGPMIVGHPNVELNLAGKKFFATITCAGDQIDKWTSQREQYVKLAMAGPDNKIVAVFHKYGAPGISFKKEVPTIYGSTGGLATALATMQLKAEAKESTVIALPFGEPPAASQPQP